MGNIRVLSIDDSRALDRKTIDGGFVAGEELMLRAGRMLAAETVNSLDSLKQKVLILAGKGNNGGDAIVAAIDFMSAGISFRLCFTVNPLSLKGEAEFYFKRYLLAGGTYFVLATAAEYTTHFNEYQPALIVDAVLGTGFKPPLSEFYSELFSMLNEAGKVISVDLPSGLYADFNDASETAVKAYKTVMIGSVKKELLQKQTRSYLGRVVPVDIGFPEDLQQMYKSQALYYHPERVVESLALRDPYTHKGSYGKVLVLGGNVGMPGAVILACNAALKSGAGLVSFVSHRENYSLIHAALPEVTSISEELLFKNPAEVLASFDAVLAGPGLGKDDFALRIFSLVLENFNKTLVLDADALNLLAEREISFNDKQEVILTPHPKEAARLLECRSSFIEKDRFKAVENLSSKFACSVVLKGTHTLTKVKDQPKRIYFTGTPAMAQGGAGDVLGGMITSFAAQGFDKKELLSIGVALHGEAALSLTNKGFFGWGAQALCEEIYQTYRSLYYKSKGVL